ncbi:MAG: dTDP-4-dehydrorhamnose reductase [Bacilli bacterium]|nr:dTDP-4-dehydrorhamnose reductase [Bacilli bacterium]
MRSLITGVTGQLGYDVVKELNSRGHNFLYAPTRREMNLLDEQSIRSTMESYKPDVVFHCAAYTAVDKAETDVATATSVNVDSTKVIAEECKKLGAKLIYVSTDYVFDGTKPLDELYEVTDKTNPKSIYGLTKLMGEKAALNNPKTFIARTSWVFGINGNNFVKTMLNCFERFPQLTVVADQFGSPTYTVDLAKTLVDMAETDKYGLYHVNNEGYCSWHQFADTIREKAGKDTFVKPVTTEEYYAPQYEKAEKEGRTLTVAYRPRNSKLSKKSLTSAGFDLLPNWEEALDRYLIELKEDKKVLGLNLKK